MSGETAQYKLPSRPENTDGDYRKAGFELEFSGLDLAQATDIVLDATGGRLRSRTEAASVVECEALGRFSIEIDWDYFKRKAEEAADGEDRSALLEAMGGVADLVVPVEVVCPPIPLDRLDALDPMVDALRDAGARGTGDSLLAAYGLHINVEPPHLDAQTVHAYLRAFGLLQWWLVEQHAVDVSRRASFYIGLYPEAYVNLILTRVAPEMEGIFSDYLQHNASRNRALDLLPLLAQIDEKRVTEAIDDPRIKARPAFHYRLPNCSIERKDWSLSAPWAVWCTVDDLAARPDDLDELGGDFLRAASPLLGVNRTDWIRHVDQWLRNRALV